MIQRRILFFFLKLETFNFDLINYYLESFDVPRSSSKAAEIDLFWSLFYLKIWVFSSISRSQIEFVSKLLCLFSKWNNSMLCSAKVKKKKSKIQARLIELN